MASANWLPLGNVYYEKIEIYSLDWGSVIDLSKHIIAGAPYGGPLAVKKDDSNNPNLPVSVRPIIYVYTSAGKLLSEMRWNSGNIKLMGWSYTEDLLFVQDDGTVLIYDIFLNFKRQFSMGQEVKDTKVLDARIFSSYKGTGIAILTHSYRIFIVNSIDDLRVRRLAEVPGLNSAPSSWCIITMDGQSQALVAKHNELYLVDHGGQYQQQFIDISKPNEAITYMAISFNNKQLAMFTESGLVWIGSADLKKRYCEFNTKSPTCPRQLVWCGAGAVIASWDIALIVIGPDKDYLHFPNDSVVHVVEEEDGVRLVGRNNLEFLRRVPSVTEQIFKIASMEPGAMLFEASREFERESPRADEYIRAIKDQLEDAVSLCIKAAGHEMDPKQQRALLKAATFGKCFLTGYKPEPFVKMCQMLRVLNQVRRPEYGIALTYTQLERLTMPVLIDRLVLRKHFYLAIQICQSLKVPETEGASRILAHWACYKVQQHVDDDESCARAIAEKMVGTPGVSFSEIASKALECGKEELAIRLLDYEPKAAKQVPLLLQMKRDSIALTKAIDSGDTDLIYFVLLRLKETMQQGDFFMTIRNMPVAYALFIQYCRHQNVELMEKLFYQEDNFQEEATCLVIKSSKIESLDGRLKTLTSAKESYVKARNDFAVKEVDDQIKLIGYQFRLEEELKRPYMNLSLHQTIHQLIVEKTYKMAEQLRKEFKVPEKRYWWLRIDALAKSGDFIELDKFSRAKKPILGMEAFAEACMKYNNKSEALKYIPRVAPDKKVKCLVDMGQLKMAAEVALETKDEMDLNRVLRKCTAQDRGIEEQIRACKVQLASVKK